MSYAFYLDAAACSGCKACQVACQDLRRQVVERTVRLDVRQSCSRREREPKQRASLMDDELVRLVGCDRKRAAAEALEIVEARMRADHHAAFQRRLHGAAHHRRVASVEAARNVGGAGR
jgi:Fe-S-cluster-containing hydrogenase component 2